MKSLLAALALAALTSAALAGPVPLTDAQLDAVTAGNGGASGGTDPGVYGGQGGGIDPGGEGHTDRSGHEPPPDPAGLRGRVE